MTIKNIDDNTIFSSLRDAEKKEDVIKELPEGYLEVHLSTKGKLGAPSIVHVRNFKVRDLLALSLTEKEDTSRRLIEILNDMIYEDVDVATWHEKEVEELMVHVLMTFFTPVLDDVVYPYNDEDLEFIRQSRSDADECITALKDGTYVPRVTINIANDLDDYSDEVGDDFKKNITIRNKKTGFYVTFGYIKFGDQITIRKWLNSFFAKEEEEFATVKKMLEYNTNLLRNVTKENFEDSSSKLINIDTEMKKAYDEYMIRRVQVLTEAVKLISVVDYNGMDVSEMGLADKYELMANDARIDYGMISKLNAKQTKMKFGIKQEVRMISPFGQGVVSRPLSFRVSDILQTIYLLGASDNDDLYDDEG